MWKDLSCRQKEKTWFPGEGWQTLPREHWMELGSTGAGRGGGLYRAEADSSKGQTDAQKRTQQKRMPKETRPFAAQQIHFRGAGVTQTRHEKPFCSAATSAEPVARQRAQHARAGALTISSSWFWICLWTSAIWKSTSPAKTRHGRGLEAPSLGGDTPWLGQVAPHQQGGVCSQTHGWSWSIPGAHLRGAVGEQIFLRDTWTNTHALCSMKGNKDKQQRDPSTQGQPCPQPTLPSATPALSLATGMGQRSQRRWDQERPLILT